MKDFRILFLAAGFASILYSSFAQSPAKLGMSRAEVKALETNVLIKDSVAKGQTFMVYKGKLESLEATNWYFFNDNKLWSTEYLLKGSPENCLKQQAMISQSLTELYGGPRDSKEDWITEYYQAHPERKGHATELGGLKLVSRWEASDLIVEVRLWENNMSSLLVVHYDVKRSGKGKKK